MTQCLIVEGTPEDWQQLEGLLSCYGFDLEAVDRAEDALDLCRRQMPHVIVMTERLETMDSADFLARLHRAAPGTEPRVIVYADAADAEAIGRHIWSGAAECIVKPFDAEVMDLKLRQVGAL